MSFAKLSEKFVAGFVDQFSDKTLRLYQGTIPNDAESYDPSSTSSLNNLLGESTGNFKLKIVQGKTIKLDKSIQSKITASASGTALWFALEGDVGSYYIGEIGNAEKVK